MFKLEASENEKIWTFLVFSSPLHQVLFSIFNGDFVDFCFKTILSLPPMRTLF